MDNVAPETNEEATNNTKSPHSTTETLLSNINLLEHLRFIPAHYFRSSSHYFQNMFPQFSSYNKLSSKECIYRLSAMLNAPQESLKYWNRLEKYMNAKRIQIKSETSLISNLVPPVGTYSAFDVKALFKKIQNSNAINKQQEHASFVALDPSEISHLYVIDENLKPFISEDQSSYQKCVEKPGNNLVNYFQTLSKCREQYRDCLKGFLYFSPVVRFLILPWLQWKSAIKEKTDIKRQDKDSSPSDPEERVVEENQKNDSDPNDSEENPPQMRQENDFYPKWYDF